MFLLSRNFHDFKGKKSIKPKKCISYVLVDCNYTLINEQFKTCTLIIMMLLK